jgi:type III pantothenate kinase
MRATDLTLVVDIGNSNVVFGLFEGEHCIKTWRTNTVRNETEQYYQLRLTEYFLESDIVPSSIAAVVMSSVVPDLSPLFSKVLKKINAEQFAILDHSIYHKLQISTSNPYEMGTDLMANAIAAYDIWQENTIIVDFGTALTFTWVKENGEIGGVNIVPGIKTAINALSSNAAQLHSVPLKMPDQIIGKNTIGAIQAGVLIGYQGLIRHMIQSIETQVGKACKTIATGGLAGIIPALNFDLVDKELTLKGLNWVAQKVILNNT